MAKKQGRLAKLLVSTDSGSTFNEIGCARDISLNLEKSEINATVRDDEDWEDFIEGRKSGTIDVSALWNEDDAELMIVLGAFYDDVRYTYRWMFEEVATKPMYTATCIVTSFTKGAPNDDASTADFTLRIKGAVTSGVQS